MKRMLLLILKASIATSCLRLLSVTKDFKNIKFYTTKIIKKKTDKNLRQAYDKKLLTLSEEIFFINSSLGVPRISIIKLS